MKKLDTLTTVFIIACMMTMVSLAGDGKVNTMPNTTLKEQAIAQVECAEPEDHLHEEEIMCFEELNTVRVANGLAPLTYNTALDDGALLRTNELTSCFSHTRPNGTDYYTAWNEADPEKSPVYGENAAYGYATGAIVMEKWMNSEDHRKNILNPKYKSVSIKAVEKDGVVYWIQAFSYNAA